MTIYRAPRPDSGFLIVRNEVARDNRLSLKARGLLLLILSRPDNWRTTAEQLATENKEGRTAILSAFKELREVGYMRQMKTRDKQGRLSTITSVFDHPESENLIPVPTREDAVSPLVTPEEGYPESDEPTPNRRTDQEEPEKVARKRADRSIARPDDWQPNDSHRAFADENDLALSFEAEQFKNHHDSKGSRFVDWDKAFRTWLGNSVKWGGNVTPIRPKPTRRETPPAPDRESLPW